MPKSPAALIKRQKSNYSHEHKLAAPESFPDTSIIASRQSLWTRFRLGNWEQIQSRFKLAKKESSQPAAGEPKMG